MSKKEMAVIDIDAIKDLNDYERKLVEKLLRPDSKLRLSKPSVPRKVEIRIGPNRFDVSYRHITEEAILAGEAAYVWRMVAFQISPEPRHHCMPALADNDMTGSWEEKRERTEELDSLVERIVDSVHPSQWHGIRRWGQAMGQVGAPVVRQGGTIVYW